MAGREAVGDGEGEERDQLARRGADDAGAEHPPALVGDELGDARSPARWRGRASFSAKDQRVTTKVVLAPLPRRRLGEPDLGDLRVGIGDAGNELGAVAAAGSANSALRTTHAGLVFGQLRPTGRRRLTSPTA